MSVDRIILHVGSPKTGTTFLQTALTKHTKQFEQLGVKYLSSYRASVSHNKLMMILPADPKDAKSVQQKILHEIDNSSQNIAIISTELAFGAKATKHLLDVFPGGYLDKIEVIFYARRQDLLMEAMIKQKMKTGRYKGDIDAFIATRAKNYTYMEYINNITKNFPNLKVIYRPYDRRMLINGDIVDDFCSFLNVDYEKPDGATKHDINVTPCKELAVILAHHPFENANQRRKTIDKIYRNHPELFKSKDIMDSQTRKKFMEAFRLDNRALSEYCGFEFEALFNDTVDFEAESRNVATLGEYDKNMELAARVVKEFH